MGVGTAILLQSLRRINRRVSYGRNGLASVMYRLLSGTAGILLIVTPPFMVYAQQRARECHHAAQSLVERARQRKEQGWPTLNRKSH
jgi:hypothetical protein